MTASNSANEQRVFYYQPPLAGTDQAFVLGLTSPFFKRMAADCGDGRAVLMDSTFGMNHHKVRDLCLLCVSSAISV